jgi:hypothetical protein
VATDSGPSWPSAVVAVAVIALVGVMFWRAVDADYEKIWAGVGTIVGVVTGAIPAYFFRQDAQQANAKAQALSAVASKDQVQEAREFAPAAFQ